MSYIETQLDPGERIVYRVRTRWTAYIWAIALLVGLMAFGRFTGLVTTELALTDKRVIGKTGLIRRKYVDLPYAAIAVARAQRGLFGILFDYGALTIVGNDGSRVKFLGLAEPLDIQIQIEEAVEMAVLGRKLSQALS